ncbi:hypothetical protein SALBM135S_01700 [Streptomyces alboniger]
MIIEQAPAEETAAATRPGNPGAVVPVALSGSSEAALRRQAGRLREWLEARPN